MVELKVSVDGVQRVVCGVSEATRCQDVVLALAQATGQIGRFNLVEVSPEAERSLRPHERPLAVMSGWAADARQHTHFLMRRLPGATPANSRPPSVTKEMAEAFPTGGGFPQKRQTSVRRSQTFSGYRGGVTGDRLTSPSSPSSSVATVSKESTSATAERRRDLTETVAMQRDRIANQHRDLAELDALLGSLCEWATPDSNTAEDAAEAEASLEADLDEMEALYRRNKAELRELEFWENELDVETQLREALERETAKASSRLARCQEELSARQQEVESLARRVEEAKVTAARLAEMREEVALLLTEQEDYDRTSQEMDAALAELDRVLEEKCAEEVRLTEELAQANMADFSQTSPATEPPHEDAPHSTQSMDRSSRQRTPSTSAEVYATFPFRRLVSARHPAAEKSSATEEDQPDGIFV